MLFTDNIMHFKFNMCMLKLYIITSQNIFFLDFFKTLKCHFFYVDLNITYLDWYFAYQRLSVAFMQAAVAAG
jgi:hypothetical protein